MKDTNTRLRDAEIEISKLAKTARQTADALAGLEDQTSAVSAGLDEMREDVAGIKETNAEQAAALAETQTSLAEVTARAEENAQSISALAETLDSVKARAEANSTNLTHVESRLEGLETAKDSYAAKISALENAVAENAAAIAQNASAIADSAENIAENAAQIDQNTRALEAHAETLTDFDTSIKFLSNTSSDLLERVALLESNGTGADTSALEAQMAEVAEAAAANANSIQALQTTVATLQSATQINATNIAENTAKIAGIQENYRVMANALNRIAELEKLHGLAEEVWGTRGTSVEEITALLDDYTTESNFCTETTTHLQFGTFGDTGPSARIFFRQNPLRTTSPKVVLRFDFSNLSSGIGALPCNITLNGITLFSGSLSVDTTATEFQATADLTIDPSAHNIVMFNEINVQFNDTSLANTILDFVEVEITNSQNCIVLNRANHVNIYGWVNKAAGTKRLVCSKYYKGQGFKTFMSTGSTHLMDLESSATAFPATTAGGYPVVWAWRYLQENFNIGNNGKFTTTTNYQLDYYINSQNQLFVINNLRNANTLTATYPHLDNVLYAKKSLHNGVDFFIEYATIVFQDFSIGLHYARYYDALENNLLSAITCLFANENYPKEFVDFIPVYDHTVGATKTTKQNIGYFFLHKSGNILFVPEKEATYFIKIGKGRQVTASYHTDFMGIDVFYEFNGKIYKKVLERTESNSTEWTLSENVEIIENADCIFDNDIYRFKINKGEIIQEIKA